MKRHPVIELVVLAGACAAVTAGLILGGAGRREKVTPPRDELVVRTARFTPRLGRGLLEVRSKDDALVAAIDIGLVVDGVAVPLPAVRENLEPALGTRTRRFPIDLGSDTVTAEIAVREGATGDGVALTLALTGPKVAAHKVSLRAEAPSGKQEVFASGFGDLVLQSAANLPFVVVDFAPHPLAFASPDGPLEASTEHEDPTVPPEEGRVSVATQAVDLPARYAVTTELHVIVGESSESAWRSLSVAKKMVTGSVKGAVTGASGQAVVFGRDESGTLRVRARTDASGHFDLESPRDVVNWFATIDAMHTSSPIVRFEPGTASPLALDVSPGGDLHVIIRDPDTDRPLTARLLVRGEQGSLDPNFGPDYRASGAGPDIDVLRGEISTPLPSGHYRVAATKGFEWSIDQKSVVIESGKTTDLSLSLRHVVPTPLYYGCDLHVHARPSFDTPVSTEDRVLSLVTAGVDFAVPTEHNIVGDYGAAVAALGLADEFRWVNGVEVTTFGKSFGHFGVFPYPPKSPVPPYKNTNLGALVAAARGGDRSRFLQINHPRLTRAIGYFNVAGFDGKGKHPATRINREFDGIEVFNGFDSERIERVEAVMEDYFSLLNDGSHLVATGSSDSHRIQFLWAGYPRTMIKVSPNEQGEVAPLDVVKSLKRGHATVTSGPVIEFSVNGGEPGDTIRPAGAPLHGHIRILAAPWVDVTHVDIIARGTVVMTFDVPSEPLKTGEEAGTLAEAQSRTVRLDREFDLPAIPPAAPSAPGSWVLAKARGTRRMDDILPFMPLPPFAFTNPIFIDTTP